MDKKLKQSKLCFMDGQLEYTIQKKKKDKKHIIKKIEQLPTPLPESYKPPKNLNQYNPILQSVNEQIVHEKITYLDTLLQTLRNKCVLHKKDFTEIEHFYNIYNNDDARLIISMFKRNIPNDEQYYKRLATEFRLVKLKKFTKVFLQVLEILDIADRLKIPHIIRGSAGSSLICYLLRITDIDPILENVCLARFMHIQRDDLPDIDIDFPSNRRDEIYTEIFTTYGNRVARISNHVKYSDKTALKQSMRNHGHHKFLPKDFNINDFIENEDEKQKIIHDAEHLHGSFAHYSLHCGGIIIFDKPIPQEYLLKTHDIQNSKFPEIQWQQSLLNKDQVDDYMFIKIDILSNRGLTELWDIQQIPIESYPPDDNVYQLLQQGENLGIVYSESRAMRKALLNLKPKSIQDIALALAIIRPIAREQKSSYFKNFHDIEKSKDYLIYDDDAIHYISRLLNCSESDADIYRKAFSKGKYGKQLEFMKKLKETHPEFTEDKYNLIFEQLCQLQSYSFCKSHAISYAKLVYALAYCKYHMPVEFWISALNNCNSSYRKWVYFREAAAIGIQLTRGYAPWKWNQETSSIISHSQRKVMISLDEELNKTREQIKVLEYFKLGYWCDEEFLSNMYLTKDPQPTKKKKKIIDEQGNKKTIEEDIYYWRFRGLISNYRCCKTFKKIFDDQSQKKYKERNITFVTIGYDNSKYLDIVLYGKIGLSKVHVIEGYGLMQDEHEVQWLKVEKWNMCTI